MRVALVFVPVVASAAVAGSPVVPHPGVAPTFWFEYLNDDLFPTGTSDDDMLTYAFSGGVAWRTWRVGADYRSLTSRDAGRRVDEWTAIVGSEVFASAQANVVLGIGLRGGGDLGGQKLQTEWHEASGEDDIDLVYEREDARALAVLDAAYRLQHQSIGVWPRTSIAANDDFAEVDARLVLFFEGDDVDSLLWLAPVYRTYVGETYAQTADEVHDELSGLAVEIGARMHLLMVRVAIGSGSGFGAVTIAF